MNKEDLPTRWQERLNEYLKGRAQLDTSDFINDCVEIQFDDNSAIMFNHAFTLESETEVALFTEHCGYHVFQKSVIVEVTYLN